jgi:probable rRNA maturation factor
MRKPRIPRRLVNKITAYVIGHYLLPGKDYKIGVFFVGRAGMVRLNKKFFNRKYATDVIAAPIETTSDLPVVLLGDVFICQDTAMEQAREYRHSYTAEIALLVTHGILHLLGYDDLKPKDRKKMRQEEQKILSALDFIK